MDPKTNKPIKGFYATGWIKRGPSGVIGTNKTDSAETVKSMIDDINNEEILAPEITDPDLISDFIKMRQPNYISYKDWLIIDAYEKKKGEESGRPRVKFTNIEDILKHLKKN